MKPPITPAYWLDRSWKYIPSTEHSDSTKFKERMERRRKEAQETKPQTTERKQ